MNVKASICFLFASLSCGFVAGDMDTERHRKEIEMMPRGLGVYNNNGKLVTITTEQDSSIRYTSPVSFTLYTKNNRQRGQEIQVNDTTNLANTNFDAKKPTYLVTHGWFSTGNSPSCTLIRDAYLENTDSNVIVVDWSKHSVTIDYVDACYKVRIVGRTVANMIKYLYTRGLRSKKITLVGHSLGAHVMGIAGYNVQPKVEYIVGLDPALPMFNFAPVGEALTKMDAKHVQIIHTNAGGLGYLCPHGHSDFFPNGGVKQEGCCDNDNIIACAACSHDRAFIYFAESITNTFNATLCKSYVEFESYRCARNPHNVPMGGLNLGLANPGTYYLRTGHKKPFSVPYERADSQKDFTPLFANAVCEVLYYNYKID